MEGIAIGVAKKALDSVVSTASKAITDEIGLLLGVQEELFFIKEELEMMQAFLWTASMEETKGKIVTTWVKQVQELSYDVEDCLQEASIHLTKKGYLNAIKLSKARDRIARQIKVLKVRIEDVSKRNLRYGLIKSSTKTVPLDFMDKPMAGLTANEKAFIVGQSKPKEELLTQIFENPDACKVISVVGMGGRGKTTLVKNVYVSNELGNQFQCFAWITVLHPFSMEEFVKSLARELSLLDQEQGKKKQGAKKRRFGMEELKRMIIEHIKDKKYVIVLDDLASETEWIKIKSIFKNEGKGSRFIVTTRSEPLAESISNNPDIYRLQALSRDDSLALFYRAVYKNSDYTVAGAGNFNHNLRKSKSFSHSTDEGEQPDNDLLLQRSFGYSSLQQEMAQKQALVDYIVTEDMETQASNIIKRCGNLPLAIVAIGSFLATRHKTSVEWKAMHDHINSEIDSNPQLEGIKTVLTTSYDGLPYHLKSCFLYLGVFHNHQLIRRSRIVRRWMAEGFLVERRDMMAEEVGESYFNDLMGRSLIQPSESLRIENDAVTQCNIHDLIYEMIVTKSENENVLSYVGDQSRVNMNCKAQHVVIQDGLEEKNNALRRMKLSSIRSVTVFGKVGRYATYHKMRLLRVLDLEGTLGLKNRDIRKIGKLRHLRYLGLRGTTITELPGSLEKLHDLETLDIRDTWVLELPRGIVKLQKLSYLRAGFDTYKSLEVYDRFKGSLVVRIPMYANITLLSVFCLVPYVALATCCCFDEGKTDELWSNLFWCRCLCGNYCQDAYVGPVRSTNYCSIGLKAPRGMRKLRSLRNFGTVDIGQSIASAKELKYLRNLTKIAIVGFSKKNGKNLGEAIEELIHLKSLLLAASDRLGLGCCLESINTPPKYLQSLKLFSPIDNLPSWFSSLDNLVKLYFRDTELLMVDIKAIEMLSNLKIFILLKDSFKGEQLCFGPNTFPMLQVMILDYIKNWSRREVPLKVLIEETALQKLTHLTIRDRESKILRSELESRNEDSEVLIPRWELKGLESLIKLKEVVLDNMNVDVVKSVNDMISRNPNNPDVRCLNIPTIPDTSLMSDVNLNIPNRADESD